MMENVTLDHKTSHKGQFSKIEIYTMYCWLLLQIYPSDDWFCGSGSQISVLGELSL